MSNARVLITGALGYVGSVAMDVLRENGYETWGLDVKPEPKCSEIEWQCRYGNRFIQNADCRSLAHMDAAMLLAKPEYIVHCAGLIQVGQSKDLPFEYWDNNLNGTLQVLRAAEMNGVKGVVIISSAAVYGDQVGIMTINSRTIPSSVYGWTKLAAETLALQCKVPTVCLRLFNVAGASKTKSEQHTDETHLIPLALRAAKTKTPLRIFGDGSQVRDYIHVEDVCYAIARAIHVHLSPVTPAWKNEVYNVGRGVGTSVMDVVRMVQEVTTLDVPVIFGPRREGDPDMLVADPVKSRGILPQPTKDIRAIIQSQWNHMC